MARICENFPARSGAKASGTISTTGFSAAVFLPAISGAPARLTPKPATTRSPDRSSRIPANLASPSSKSLGHFKESDAPGAANSTASISARPATRVSAGADGSPGRNWTMVEPRKLPSIDSQTRPWRPLPASWRFATSQSPSTESGSDRSAPFVDPTLSTMRIRVRISIPRPAP